MQFKTNFLISAFIVLLLAHPVFSKNIAVMPFENIKKDTDKNWIGAGFAETLTTKLCKVKEVTLLEREQLSKILDEIKFQHSGIVDENTAVKTGKMYGVDVMVFGSYQVINDTLRVDARFVDVEKRKVIDTAEATGSISDIFKLQDEIVFSLMDSLKIVLGEKDKQEIKINSTEILTAYQWFSKGLEADNLQIYDDAIEYYQKAINLDPKYEPAYANMGAVYDEKGNYGKAIEMYKKAVSINPDNAITFNNMGAAYISKRPFGEANYNKAIEMCEKAISINPEFAEAYANMGVAYCYKGNLDKAIKMGEKAVNINPENADAYYNIGFAYVQKGNYDKAIIYYKKAARLGHKEAQKYLTGKGIDW